MKAQFFQIVDKVLGYHPRAEVRLLEKAYVYSALRHGGKVRLPGEAYLSHPLAVAAILANMRLDEETIAAGLLHDLIEYGLSTAEELEAEFGPNVTEIVLGVTKLSQLDFSRRQEHQTEYVRKMILAIARDIRVVLVKLADRLHDMKDCETRPCEVRQSMAIETVDIYAPLAARLGIEWMKQELENRAFRSLEPEAYENIVQGLARTEQERQRYIEEVLLVLSSELRDHGIKGRVTGRNKHLYSIHLKMMRQNLDLSRVYDLIAFRIIVESDRDCYEALAMVHALWEPVQGRFKDYITKPKSNMYQSLHTTVLGPRGEKMEIQIRTEEMNRVAKEGIAAHWLYKEGRPRGESDEEETRRFSWLRELLEMNKEYRDPKALFDAVKMDLYPDEVYVFTPQGDVKAFPRGSTPVDFAYEVHTEVGHRCVGARVNGKLVQLRQELKNGDSIEILTAPNHRPSKDWLKFVKTSKAINRIKHWFKAEERERSIALGREICEKEFRKKGLNFNTLFNSNELQEAAKAFSLRTVDDLLAAVGFSKVTPFQVIGRLPSVVAQAEEAEKEKEREREELPVLDKKKPKPESEGIVVLGVDDVMTRLARCCNPLPGTRVIGYITRGRGITVHRRDCKSIERADDDRKIEVQWETGGQGKAYPVDIRVVYAESKGMLANLSSVAGQLDARIANIAMESSSNGVGTCRLTIEVKDNKHMQRVLLALRSEKGVYRAARVMD